MYQYNKMTGLTKISHPDDELLQIDMMSDLHLDFYLEYENASDMKDEIKAFIDNSRKSLYRKNDEVLIVGGDISHENEISKETLIQLSKIWKYVLVIPGNHDWYLQSKSEDRYKDLITSLNNVDNIIFLMDKVEIFEYKGVKIAGTIMFYNLDEIKNYTMWKEIMMDSTFLSRDFIMNRNKRDVEYYNKVINHVDVFVSHVPIVNLDGRQTTENLFLNMDVSPVKDTLYISGHTHKPRNSVDLKLEYDALNISYGYPSEILDTRKAITSVYF